MCTDKTPDPIMALQTRLLGELPDDISKARDAYHRLAGEAAGIMDAKEFSAHQAACKAALGHLESLIKLLRWACEGAGKVDDDTSDKSNVDQLIAEARSTLNRA
ncbi:hypothetical protein DYI21_14715 [Thalassospira tepidiphila]|jgi:hypothetical protein|uniref:hypothetical protein n=1 Tax=Thalassospira tepidiphila TaxID=393657 RepID=UPI001BCCC6F5|nr:hypothetical protein [Thalassospira tepidiphila]MBS8274841.1 hypothetical protein [Thalassospira tepidiphila]